MKKIILLPTLASLFFFSCAQPEYYNSDLASQMRKLGTDTALIVNSYSIDQTPIWAPDSSAVAANISGTWYQFPISNMILSSYKWGGKVIGIMPSKDSASMLRPGEVTAFHLVSKLGVMDLKTEKGARIELDPKGFSTALVITYPGATPQLIWNRIANCHHLSLSPDEIFLAYVCESYGLFVTKVN